MDTPKNLAFKVAMLRNPRDGEPKVITYTIEQLVKLVQQAQVSSTTFEAYHFQKSEDKRLTVQARAAQASGDIEKANELKSKARTYGLAVDRTKFGRAIMPFIFQDDITFKTDIDGRHRRDADRITHFSLLMLDVESKTTTAELHHVLRDYEYILWPTITHHAVILPISGRKLKFTTAGIRSTAGEFERNAASNEPAAASSMSRSSRAS